MTEEENKAIKSMKEFAYTIHGTLIVGEAKTILNLIENQKAEIEKKDKIIELMAEKLEKSKVAYFKKEDGGEFMGKYRTYNKNDWKQYFEKKLEEDK